MQGYCDVYKWTILKRTSPEVKCLHPTSSRREMCTYSVSNVIYHKFSHGAAFYTLNGKNINAMLEYLLTLVVDHREREVMTVIAPSSSATYIRYKTAKVEGLTPSSYTVSKIQLASNPHCLYGY